MNLSPFCNMGNNKLNFLLISFYLSSLIHFCYAYEVTVRPAQPRKFIIDTDAGADDALALLLALQYEAAHKDEIQIIAITCTHGNTAEKNVETNVLKVLTIAKRNDIPVYGGAERSLTNFFKDKGLFGKDGLGDFEFGQRIIAQVDRSKYAAVALVDLVKAYPGEVSIIALGPVTNLALATRLEASFIQNIDELIIMGSTITGYGTEGAGLEFNFAVDPESNFIVMNSTVKPCTLVPFETFVDLNPTKEWRRDVFGKLNSSSVAFINKVEAGVNMTRWRRWSTIDAIAVAVAIWPEMIKKSLITNVTPVFDGAARGTVLVDHIGRTGKPHNAKIVQSYDVEFFKQRLLECFSR